jgi:hypothetical protein
MTEPRLTAHARERMKERNITEDEIRSALTRRTGTPAPASPGKIWVFGHSGQGRILKVLLTSNEETIVTVVRVGD